MDTTKAHRIIAASASLVFIIGIANSVFKHGKLPSFRFFVGVGVVYLVLSALAEKEPEIANAFAIAILTGAVLSPDSEKGWLSYFQSSKNEMAAPEKGELVGELHPADVSRREPGAGVSVPGELGPGLRVTEVYPNLSEVGSVLPPIAGIIPSALDKRRSRHITRGVILEEKECSCHG